MGQGQEAPAENALDRRSSEGGWVLLQNVHLMQVDHSYGLYIYGPCSYGASCQSWLPTLERKLEIAAEKAHTDFRCFLSAEPPPLPSMRTIPESILQAR